MDLPNNETGDALRGLVEDGSDLTKPMEIDFFIAVPDSETGEKIGSIIRKNQFKCSVEQDNETKEWTCYANKTLIPSYENVSAIEINLDKIAKDNGASLDGFGSYGNAPS